MTVNSQLHGYRQGHQLLDSNVTLSKSDQSIVDRLSDMAGPLRPGELFDSYLSAYPLPSDQFYVLARTWQDTTVPRAGCVRTLSLIISVETWQDAGDLQPFLDFLDPLIFPSAAITGELISTPAVLLPQAPEFCASELLEALFLEDLKPVALFDAPSPEIIAVRLLTALWPALRRRFALCTYALSPRKIEGRNFDLVFAPKNVRSKFADWPGRKIDARLGKASRHRWTDEIVERVFWAPKPWLLDARDIRQLGKDESGAPAALRIALLWDELLGKLEESPTAALGLLDIANFKMNRQPEELHELQPALAVAAQQAVEILTPPEAWEFLGAMVGKIIGTPFSPALDSVTKAAGLLAGRNPTGAVALLDHLSREDVIDVMVPALAEGFAVHFGDSVGTALAASQFSTFTRLVMASPRLARATLSDQALVKRMEQMIPEIPPLLCQSLRDEIMPALVDDMHANLARPLFATLDVAGVLAEVEYLERVSGFHSKGLLPPLIERARQLSAIEELRGTLLMIPSSTESKDFLRMTLCPDANDVWWLLKQTDLSREVANMLLQDVVGQSDAQEFRSLLADPTLARALLERLSDVRDVLLRAVTEGELPLTLSVPIVLQLLPESTETKKRELATILIGNCLQEHFGGKELLALSTLLGILGSSLDGGLVVRTGLRTSLSASIINRNVVAFNKSPKDARNRILEAIEELAENLSVRMPLDLDEGAAAACAELLWDAQSVNLSGLLRGSGRLLPTLFRSGQAPVSAIVAATFPLIYRELAKEDDVPYLFKFVPFIDWDRCKAARRQLVEIFLPSEAWRPSDLALTACRSSDIGKILQCVAKSYRGDIYLSRISADLKILPKPCRDYVQKTIRSIKLDKSGKDE